MRALTAISLFAVILLCAGASPTPERAEIVAPASPPALIAIEQPCEPGEDVRTSDLCAQWKAADAARASAVWTERMFWLSLVGLLVGAGTLFAAVMAARYAKHAAREARRTADTAHNALVYSERAWITVDLFADGDFTFHPTGSASLPVWLEVKNIGRTPALNVHTDMTMITTMEDHPNVVKEFADAHRVKDTKNSRSLLPGDAYPRKWVPHLDSWKGSSYAIIVGCVTYETLPDDALHQTTFTYYVGRGEVGRLDGTDIAQGEVHFTVKNGGFAD